MGSGQIHPEMVFRAVARIGFALVGLAAVLLGCGRAFSNGLKSASDSGQKAAAATNFINKRQIERDRLSSFYSTRESECAKLQDTAAFLKANGRDASLADTAAKDCYQEVADYREAMLHLDDMFAPLDETSHRLRFEMDAVHSERDMVIFWNYRNALWAVQKASDVRRILKVVDAAQLDWERSRSRGVVVELQAGSVVSDLHYHYADIDYLYTKRELVFTMTADGKPVFMPAWQEDRAHKPKRSGEPQ